ncbi:MAG TPA: Fe-S-containing hydro-lyase [Chitinispirillaceae bacterium]|nr:Fe-S-containing hydro-lyase [Chitinispirillaceae bacterium]
MKQISTPFSKDLSSTLRAGDQVLLSGTIFTARDAAHKRLFDLMVKSERLPIDLHNQIIYYTGPTPAHPGKVIGSAGPTTSSRMDKYTPQLIEESGLSGIIGKGNRSDPVIEALKKYQCTYFAAVGGAGALLSMCIKKCEPVLYEDLGPEAIYKLGISEFPLIVAIDCLGNNLYLQEPLKYRKQ